MPVNFIYVAGAGLLIAIATGAGSFLFGVPFLTHTFGHFHLPVLGNTELATATLFDLGVYLVVVGVTMTIIQTIGGKNSGNLNVCHCRYFVYGGNLPAAF